MQSNETSNGYFLERSHSARMTLAKACELCPEEVKKATSVQQIGMEESKVILYFVGQCLCINDNVKKNYVDVLFALMFITCALE